MLQKNGELSFLIPLNKNPGVRPIGVGEVLRRIMGKAVSWACKEEIKQAAGPLQTCAGFQAGAEAAIHAMQSFFREEETDAVLLIDASNAFNSMNRRAALVNIQVSCPVIAGYVIVINSIVLLLCCSYRMEAIYCHLKVQLGRPPCTNMVLHQSRFHPHTISTNWIAPNQMAPKGIIPNKIAPSWIATQRNFTKNMVNAYCDYILWKMS